MVTHNQSSAGESKEVNCQQINGALVITNLQQSDAGNYTCTATSAGVFNVEAVTALEIQKGGLVILEKYCVIIR